VIFPVTPSRSERFAVVMTRDGVAPRNCTRKHPTLNARFKIS